VKFILLFLILTHVIFSYEIEHFLLPSDGNKAEKSLMYDIGHAKKSIKVAMFMVTNKKLTNALKERAKKGKIDIKLIADKSYDAQHQKISKVKKLVSIKNISIFSTSGLFQKKKKKFGILHSKLVIIDDDVVYVGSQTGPNQLFIVTMKFLLK